MIPPVEYWRRRDPLNREYKDFTSIAIFIGMSLEVKRLKYERLLPLHQIFIYKIAIPP